jgi:purine-nucleoside phosphorylase
VSESRLQRAVDHLRRCLPDQPDVAVVLGSGLGHLADAVADPVTVPWAQVPGLPAPGVAGHAGRFVFGRLGGRHVLLQQGRYHLYEGFSREVVAMPVRLAARLGARFLFVTNAAGGLDATLEPGSILLLDDHINLMFRSPLQGRVSQGEERFPDLSAPYDPDLQRLALEVSGELGIRLHRGVYVAVAGPSYETAAEIRMLRALGGDVVGMSTVPEVIVARALGLRCLGISMVTNLGTGLSREGVSHAEVLDVARLSGQRVGRILEGVARILPGPQEVGAK